ncbi:MAG: preprotein translocase subunit SecG [Bacteroidota bacterium]
MFLLISILIIVACVLLTLVVLIQNPKGGGIASNFTAPNQIMGARRSTDVVEKTTWILAIILISFSLMSNFFRPYGEAQTTGTDSRMKEQIDGAAMPAAPQQQAPAPQPADPNAAPADQGAQPATTEPAATTTN